MNVAEVLRTYGFVPTVPTANNQAGTLKPLQDKVSPASPLSPLEKTRESGKTEAAAQRAHLLELAKLERLPADLVHHLHDDDLLAIPDDYTDRNLTAYLRELLAAKEMDAGAIPESWGGAIAAMCEGCGPVLLHPTSPTHLKACPWCFRRKAGKAIPRPHG